MPQVVWPPGERRGLLCCGEGDLARFDPGPPVSDRGQLATSYAAEEAAVGCRIECGEMIPEQPGQLGMGRHDAAVALGPMLELSSLPRAPVVGPLPARIGRCAADVQLAPVLVLGRVGALLVVLVPMSAAAAGLRRLLVHHARQYRSPTRMTKSPLPLTPTADANAVEYYDLMSDV